MIRVRVNIDREYRLHRPNLSTLVGYGAVLLMVAVTILLFLRYV